MKWSLIVGLGVGISASDRWSSYRSDRSQVGVGGSGGYAVIYMSVYDMH